MSPDLLYFIIVLVMALLSCASCAYMWHVVDLVCRILQQGGTVDVRVRRGDEIVRCRDCKHLCDDGSTWGCGWHCSCLSTNDGTPPDGFCAWGERTVS